VLEGIEAIVFRTISMPVSPWELLLPPELLRLPEELARVDALLDDPAFFAPFAPHFHPVLGRPSTPIECYLRLMFLKFRYRLGYESLCAEVSDSISWRRFCRIGLDAKVPHPTTLMKLTTRCGEGAVAGLNEALWARAAGARLLRTARVRADTTVIAANVAYPTDAGLLAKAVGKLVRAARRVKAAGGAAGTVMTDRRRAAGRRAREMAATMRVRARLGRDESSRVMGRATGDLADLAETAAAQAAAVLRNGRRAVGRALTGRMRGRLRRALGELAVTIERTATVVAQARSRWPGRCPAARPGWSACTTPMRGRSARAASTGRWSSGIRPRCWTTTTVSSWTTAWNAAPPPTARSSCLPSNASAAGPGRCPRGHCRRGYGQAAVERGPARRGRAHRGDSPSGQDLTGPQDRRARPRLPQAGQVAHRLRRPDQLSQTRLRLGPHPAGQQKGCGDLVRTRGIHPQPGQDRRPGQLTRHSPAAIGTTIGPRISYDDFSGGSKLAAQFGAGGRRLHLSAEARISRFGALRSVSAALRWVFGCEVPPVAWQSR
jgi:IS5 family transposase